jgi:hypothetical protein
VWISNAARFDIDSVDLAEGERVIGANGETIRDHLHHLSLPTAR